MQRNVLDRRDRFNTGAVDRGSVTLASYHLGQASIDGVHKEWTLDTDVGELVVIHHRERLDRDLTLVTVTKVLDEVSECGHHGS